MNSLTLLSWIALAIAAQLFIYLGMSFWNHWVFYQALRARAVESNILVEQNDSLARPGKIELAWPGLRKFRVTAKKFEDDLKSICSFTLVPEDGQALPPFFPGQFLTFQLELPSAVNGQSVGKIVRCYSLSDAPSSEGYRVSIKRALAPSGCQIPAGVVSNFFHDQVQVGSTVLVRAPAGYFYLDQSNTPVVLIAGGIGITPMMSMLNWALLQQTEREIWLFYGVSNSHELMMSAHLAALAAAYPNFHLRLCFSDTMANGELGKQSDEAGLGCQYRGRINVELLRRQLPLKPYHYYICGPTAMLESLVPGLEEWGVPDGRIHFEAFGPASIPRKKNKAMLPSEQSGNALTITFAQSGKQVAWQADAGNLLDFAEANGLAVNAGCRAGSCGSCQTTILSGEVVYNLTPDFDPEVGSCLLCVCRPKTDVKLEI